MNDVDADEDACDGEVEVVQDLQRALCLCLAAVCPHAEPDGAYGGIGRFTRGEKRRQKQQENHYEPEQCTAIIHFGRSHS